MRPPKLHLSFGSLRNGISKYIRGLKDHREQEKVDHSIHDVVMSGLAMMHFQEPSLLQFQKHLEDELHMSNLTTLFEVKSIPKSSQMKDVLDAFSSEKFRPVFFDFFTRLQRGKQLKKFEFFPDLYIISVDGSEYFSSTQIQCSHCLKKVHSRGKKNESVTYSHQILQAALMHPDQKQVIPLMPEEVRNEDGNEKQDCEINAGKRLIERIRKDHPHLGIILNGDGLYPKSTMIEAAKNANMHFIFVCKPDGNKAVMEWVGEQKKLGEFKSTHFVDSSGRTHVFGWVNNVPLTGAIDSKNVNYFEYQLMVPQKDGSLKVTYKGSWITDFEITQTNVEALVKGARCRWKIENECFNTLKNQGYHIDHSYGHGSHSLSFNFFILNLVAFFMHQIFEMTDELYQACRVKKGSKKNLWDTIRGFIQLLIFPTWEDLLQAILRPPNLGRWDSKLGFQPSQ
jgi:hypothetical protein